MADSKEVTLPLAPEEAVEYGKALTGLILNLESHGQGSTITAKLRKMAVCLTAVQIPASTQVMPEQPKEDPPTAATPVMSEATALADQPETT